MRELRFILLFIFVVLDEHIRCKATNYIGSRGQYLIIINVNILKLIILKNSKERFLFPKAE